MAINAVTDLEDHFFFLKKNKEIEKYYLKTI